MNIIEQIIALFQTKGNGAYYGEQVSELEHALQCAYLAEESGADAALIAAALLHDIGHLLHHWPENIAEMGIDAQHETGGATWLQSHFGPAVVDPVRLHVAAKRYLCAVEDGYAEGLSPASIRSLHLQGGPMSTEEKAAFEREPWFRSAVAVRRWDDAAKVPHLRVPPIEHYRDCLNEVVLNHEEQR